MKKSILIFTFFILEISVFSQTKKTFIYDSVGTNLISINFRVLDLSPGFEVKYFSLKKEMGTAPTCAFGMVSYTNEHSIKNASYSVNGGYVKIGGVLYQKFSGAAIYAGANLIFSNSTQHILAEFKDNIWGTYSQEFSVSDFNSGLELALGVFIKIHPKVFIHLEGTAGSKILKQDNPIYHTMNVDKTDAYNLPYYSPGMGRGGVMFINGSAGIGYQF
ncbi:MAG: hypothetical protein ACOYMA_04845 [Bacteroidia bacterium]